MKRLRVIDSTDGVVLGTIDLLDDGTLAYSDDADRGIVEAMARSNGWTTAPEIFAGITGWTNGYTLFHLEGTPLPWEKRPPR
jgi:hypothetical protein